MEKRYYLHVGAPKTATTFLQTKVFGSLPGIRDNDKEGTREDAEKNQLRNLGIQLISRDAASHSYDDLFTRISEIEKETSEHKILLSEESFLGYWGRGFSNGGNMAVLLKDLFPSARILIGIREQADWLLSLYKYCSEGDVQRHFAVGSPQEFFYLNAEQFVWKLNRYAPTHTYCWVNWYQHYRKFTHLFGADNVLVLPFEMLQSDVNGAEAILTEFLEQAVAIAPIVHDVVNPSEPKSVFATADEYEKFVNHVKSLNEESNRALDRAISEIDFKDLGYY